MPVVHKEKNNNLWQRVKPDGSVGSPQTTHTQNEEMLVLIIKEKEKCLLFFSKREHTHAPSAMIKAEALRLSCASTPNLIIFLNWKS